MPPINISMHLSNIFYYRRRKISQALRENACETKKNSNISSVRNSDSSKVTQSDDFKTHHPLERKNSTTLNALQQKNNFINNKSIELSLSDIEDLIKSFVSQATGQDSSIFDFDTTIGTFPIEEMSLSFGNLSTHMESYSVY